MKSRLALALLIAFGLAACAPPPERALTYRLQEDPPTLDPFAQGDDNSNVYIYLLFDGLVEFVPGTLGVRPAVATSWTISPDGLTYTFTLRDDVTFHNGRGLTASDVVYSVRRALSAKDGSAKGDFFEALEGKGPFWKGDTDELPGVSAPDPRTVVFRLSYPYGPFLSVLASEAGSIVPHEIYSDPERGYLRSPVGSGPYRFAAWDPGVSISLQRFEGHWKPSPANGAIEKIDFRFIKDASTALEAYRAGGIDFTQEIPPGQRESVIQQMPDQHHNAARQAIFYLAFNHASGPFAGAPLLRRAVTHAIDREFIVRVLQEGKDRIASGVLPPGMMGHDPDREPAPYDPAVAAAMLDEAGHAAGAELPEIVYLSNETEGFRKIAERISLDLSRVGLQVRTRMVDFGAFMAAITAGGPAGPDAAIFRMTWYADWPDPDNFVGLQFASGAGGNFSRYSSPEFDRLMEDGRREQDPAAREALYRRADALLMEEAAILPIYWYGQDLLLKPRVKGLKISPFGPFGIAWEEMWIEE